MGILSTSYNILGAKALVRRISTECVKCQRFYAKPAQQFMGQLPPYRTTMDHPFTTTGADFAGPFKLQKGHTRKPVAVDGYACLFVCMSTKCVHIELVMDMTTDSFLAAPRRFVARCGRPAMFVTDNGSNIVGARNRFTRVYNMLDSSPAHESLSQFMVDERIQWSHSPACSPHFGGMWVARVKQMKVLLYKTLGTHMLTCEEMYSILIKVEAVLNSRPLIPMDSAPVDGAQVLTPGHFLVGRSLKALPELPDTASTITVLRRWNLCLRLSHEIWTKWSQDYQHLLQIQYHHFFPHRSV